MQKKTTGWEGLRHRPSWILTRGAPLAMGFLFSAASQATLISSGGTLMADTIEGSVNSVYVGRAYGPNFNFTILDEFDNVSYVADIDVTLKPLQNLGPLPTLPSTTSVFRQSLTIKNTSSEIRQVSFVNAVDINMGTPDTCSNEWYPYCDQGHFDDSSQVLYTTHEPWDPPYENDLLFATAVSVNKWDAKLAYDIRGQDDIGLYFEDLRNNVYNAPGDISTLLGLSLGALDPYQEIIVHFDYLWSNDLDYIPAEFRSKIPEPAPILLLALGMAGLLIGRIKGLALI